MALESTSQGVKPATAGRIEDDEWPYIHLPSIPEATTDRNLGEPLSEHLGENHFLALPRPDIFIGPPAGVPDTTTLAAHDFDVDTRTGFMPPQPPISRLPSFWVPWEDVLDNAIRNRIQLGDKPNLLETEKQISSWWRGRVKTLPTLSIEELKKSEVLLRRAHLVLAWTMHFYIHSLPPTDPIVIPAPLALPLLQVSAQLRLPPVMTYSDNCLYNWYIDGQEKCTFPTITNIRCQTSFTSTNDEAEFYLSSSRIELAGVAALDLMRSTMDETFVGDDIAIRRITTYLTELADVICHLKELLLDVEKGCNPNVFYCQIRPWFRGEDSQSGRKWVFEGIEQDPTLTQPVELSGASAGQSALIHALDIFLGVDKYSHGKDLTGHSPTHIQKSGFLKRMQAYMPRHHRAFLDHLSNNPRPLREFVIAATSPSSEKEPQAGALLFEAYNKSVLALKEFRDSHMIIVALYIIGPAHRECHGQARSEYISNEGGAPLKGTGGTDLVNFLKGVRNQTKAAILESDQVT